MTLSLLIGFIVELSKWIIWNVHCGICQRSLWILFSTFEFLFYLDIFFKCLTSLIRFVFCFCTQQGQQISVREGCQTISESIGFDLIAVHFLCFRFCRPLMFFSWFFSQTVEPIRCESDCEHMRQCGGERERAKKKKKNPRDCFCCMREKLLVITSHKLPGGRFWTECDENVPPKKPKPHWETIKTRQSGRAHLNKRFRFKERATEKSGKVKRVALKWCITWS